MQTFKKVLKQAQLHIATLYRTSKKWQQGETASLKKLTFLGFGLVLLPLVFALIYSATQVTKLSNQGSKAIFSVAELTSINQEMNERRLSLERYASQYVVLKDLELKTSYFKHQQKIEALFTRKLNQYQDASLSRLSTDFIVVIGQVEQLLDVLKNNDNALEQLQEHFIVLANIAQRINQRSSELINAQAQKIQQSAQQVSDTMLNSLFIIPIAFIIAGVFIYLITSPLKLLIEKIQALEQGDFDQSIELNSAPEINEIAEALETMRLRLHALELQKSSFIRHISHELKTPLAAIREGTELLYDNSVGELNQGQQEICQIIKQSVQRLQQHIEELLDFNIVLDSTSLQDHEKVMLQPIISQVLADHQLEIKNKKLVIERSHEAIYINSNTKQLTVIIDNILSNAIKYSDHHGKITITCAVNNAQLTMTVTDQGPGIAQDIQEKVFDAFYQGPPPSNSSVKGSGLGLTIVKELLMRLNGDIKFLPVHQDETGTQVAISLPKASPLAVIGTPA